MHITHVLKTTITRNGRLVGSACFTGTATPDEAVRLLAEVPPPNEDNSEQQWWHMENLRQIDEARLSSSEVPVCIPKDGLTIHFIARHRLDLSGKHSTPYEIEAETVAELTRLLLIHL